MTLLEAVPSGTLSPGTEAGMAYFRYLQGLSMVQEPLGLIEPEIGPPAPEDVGRLVGEARLVMLEGVRRVIKLAIGLPRRGPFPAGADYDLSDYEDRLVDITLLACRTRPGSIEALNPWYTLSRPPMPYLNQHVFESVVRQRTKNISWSELTSNFKINPLIRQHLGLDLTTEKS